jgi:hypothetical protein
VWPMKPRREEVKSIKILLKQLKNEVNVVQTSAIRASAAVGFKNF